MCCDLGPGLENTDAGQVKVKEPDYCLESNQYQGGREDQHSRWDTGSRVSIKVLILAQRLNTIMDSNRVMVLDQGNIAEGLLPRLVILSYIYTVLSFKNIYNKLFSNQDVANHFESYHYYYML